MGLGGADIEFARAGAVQQRPGHGHGNPVTQRVLSGAGLEAGGQAGEHGRVAERVTGAEQVKQPAVVRDVDAAAMDHAQERDRPGVLGQDHRTAQVKLDRRLRRDLRQLGRRQRGERLALSEEAGDLTQTGVQVSLPS
jgi:hypothetical protein